ncbi:preprotein translocase subunit SecE [Oceanococcus atlanticus]|uniref:Protein translocase subunit SecE n=1 Tax=Oceanococcus atlanticus TaxID=1317117 RepID=A0A1Y1SH51_9GAMM|nr:preprotein translocase subunit SecE [Oceanococcus atlanticus]ORE88994.1 preprotein translocase subunit SecE [Oceanococcus atlanticus]RZO82442.1 MAG: preprotein translocase subunit SecE [Oceanococcus sp.]
MSAQTETTGSALDTVLLWAAVAILAASIFGFYYFEPQFNALVRVAGMLVGGALAVVVALQSVPGKAAWLVVRESRTELRKVVWPTRPETIQTTAIILIVVLILGMLLWGIDSLLLLALEALTGRGG